MIVFPSSALKNTDYDIVVVGSGPAGLSFSESILKVKPDLRICILESGGIEINENTQKLHLGSFLNPLVKEDFQNNRARVFGGTSSMWGGESATLEEDDFEEKPYFDVSGWPIKLNELKRYYTDAAGYLRLTSYLENNQPKDEFLLQLTGSSIKQKLWHYSQPVARLGKDRREAISNSTQIDLLLGSTAVGIKSSGKKINSINIQRSSETTTINARFLVLAAGGIENPRCLLNWKSSNPDLPYNNDNIGRFFSVHPYFSLNPAQKILLFSKNHDSDWYHWGDEKKRKIHFVLSEEVRSANKWENLALMLWNPSSTELQNELPKSILDTYGKATHYEFNVMCDMRLTSESHMSLTQSRDSTGLRGINVQMQLHPKTPSSWAEGLYHMATVLADMNMGRVKLGAKERFTADYLYEHGTWGAHHHMCATRMSSTDLNGVVDKDCLVFGTDNLYVLGASTFSTASVANPTFTVVALAIRAAEHIAKHRM